MENLIGKKVIGFKLDQSKYAGSVSASDKFVGFLGQVIEENSLYAKVRYSVYGEMVYPKSEVLKNLASESQVKSYL
jgi:hypothetical protein